MIPLVRIYNGLRDEGLNFGVPTTFILLGGVERTPIEDIIEEVLKKSTKRGWTCILGDQFDPLGMGIGTLVQGLSHMQRYVEVVTDGLHRDPKWANKADRWVVDYTPNSSYNLGSLRTADSIRIKITERSTPEEIEKILAKTKTLMPVKYLRFPLSTEKTIETFGEIIELAYQCERVRVYAGIGDI